MKKGRSFIWEQEQQVAFEEIKKRLQKPPILHLPDNKGRFNLYSDTSNYAQAVPCIKCKMESPN